jgi:hypothetical protein
MAALSTRGARPPTAAAKLIARWESLGLPGRAGCSEERLAAFESRAGARIPADLRELLARANGAAEDPDGFCFWPLEEYSPFEEAALCAPGCPGVDDGGIYYVFCDYLQWSWAYAIRLIGPGDDEPGGRIVPVGMNEMFTVADSFSEFTDLYLRDSERLYPPAPRDAGSLHPGQEGVTGDAEPGGALP